MNKKAIKTWLPVFVCSVVVLLDQLTKYLYVAGGAEPVTLIKGFLGLYYTQNTGAAWGLLSDNSAILYIASLIFAVALVIVYFTNVRKGDFLLRYSWMLIVAGAVGNLIDRFALGYVRDMIRLLFISFPIFNVADAAISTGMVFFLVSFIFLKGSDVFDSKKRKKKIKAKEIQE